MFEILQSKTTCEDIFSSSAVEAKEPLPIADMTNNDGDIVYGSLGPFRMLKFPRATSAKRTLISPPISRFTAQSEAAGQFNQ